MTGECQTMSRVNVSVVIPTCGNRPAMLHRAISSVIGQSVQPREIIVVVDGDHAEYDKTKHDIENEFGKSYGVPITIITSAKPRSGASHARNQGAARSNSVYVSFLDDDDAWKPGYFEEIFGKEGLDYLFDIALAGFEKHKDGEARPEKVPPPELKVEHFLVSNPGLRGSNITIRKQNFDDIRGFDENLPAFNDMDFGLRVSMWPGLKYKRITKHLVEFYSHDGDRLSSRESKVIGKGIELFLQKHACRMNLKQMVSFRKRAMKLWSFDPWRLDVMERLQTRVQQDSRLPTFFPYILHALEYNLFQEIFTQGTDASKIQAQIDDLCRKYEHSAGRPDPPAFIIGLISTSTTKNFNEFLKSLKRELDASCWSKNFLPARPIHVFVLFNDDSESDKIHAESLGRTIIEQLDSVFCIHVYSTKDYFPANQNRLSIGEARRFICERISNEGITISRRTPVWLLDDDLRFTSLIPDNGAWKVRRLGSILHRVEVMIRLLDADGLVGGNTGAAPLPPLSTMTCQLKDILANKRGEHSTILQDLNAILAFMQKYPDYYYDISQQVVPEECLNIIPSWWSSFDERNDLDNIIEMTWRLMNGLPVSRPLVPRYDKSGGSAWIIDDKGIVAGGNMIIMHPDIFNKYYYQISLNGLRSRRADTCWNIISKSRGSKILHCNFDLFHDRTPFLALDMPDTAIIKKMKDNAMADILGFAFYQVIKENNSWTFDQSFLSRLVQKVENRVQRVDLVMENLEIIATDFTREVRSIFKEETPRAERILTLLLEIAKIRFNPIVGTGELTIHVNQEE